jgi:hypothetical protein
VTLAIGRLDFVAKRLRKAGVVIGREPPTRCAPGCAFDDLSQGSSRNGSRVIAFRDSQVVFIRRGAEAIAWRHRSLVIFGRSWNCQAHRAAPSAAPTRSSAGWPRVTQADSFSSSQILISDW